MTEEQFERWKDFAERMARNYPGARKATREKLVGLVDDAINWVVCNVEPADVKDWDTTEGDDPASTRMRDWCMDNGPVDPYEHKQWRIYYGDRVRACVRSGLDLAVAPSGGVVGFTVGDLKRMYPEGIPAWVSANFDQEGEPPVDLNKADPKDGVWL